MCRVYARHPTRLQYIAGGLPEQSYKKGGVSDALRQHRRNTELYGLVVLHGPFSLTLRRHTVVSGSTARIPLRADAVERFTGSSRHTSGHSVHFAVGCVRTFDFGLFLSGSGPSISRYDVGTSLVGPSPYGIMRNIKACPREAAGSIHPRWCPSGTHRVPARRSSSTRAGNPSRSGDGSCSPDSEVRRLHGGKS